MGGFLSGLFTGSNPTLSGDIGNAGNIMGFSTATGEGDIRNASGFYDTLLGGNSAAEAKMLAPEIQTMQNQGQQQINTTSEFGNRSGGTNASNQQTTDRTRANIDNMISQLTGQAASGEAAMGQGLLGTALSANQLQSDESQKRKENQNNSILGGMVGGTMGGIGAGIGNKIGSLIQKEGLWADMDQ